MPELPEVHTTVEGLKKLILGKTIKDAWSDFYVGTAHGHKNNLKNKNYFKNFKKQVVGSKIKNVERLGKNILIHLEKGLALKNNYKEQSLNTIVIHMKMTGHLLFGKYRRATRRKSRVAKNEYWTPDDKENSPLKDPFNRFVHFVLTLFDKNKKESHLVLSDMRKFASIYLMKTKKINECEKLSILGPDPLLVSKKEFTKRFEHFAKRKNISIKTFLLDQTFVAGIGNIYSDEILWASCIHPLSKPRNIPEKIVRGIYVNTQKILKKSIRLGGDSMSDYRNPYGEKGGFQNCHKAYRRVGKNCLKPKCGGIIEKMTIGGRSAHFCNKHQKKY